MNERFIRDIFWYRNIFTMYNKAAISHRDCSQIISAKFRGVLTNPPSFMSDWQELAKPPTPFVSIFQNLLSSLPSNSQMFSYFS